MVAESEFHCYSPQHSQETNPTSKWDHIPTDLTELILSYLPIPSIIRASSVSKLWNSIVNSDSFKTRISNSRIKLPWLFLFLNNTHHQALLTFEPESDYWIQLPNTALLHYKGPCAASDRFSLLPIEKSSFKQVLTWRSQTGLLDFSSSDINPLIGECSEPGYFCCINSCSDVDSQNPKRGYFEHCPPPPEIFWPRLLCSSLFKGKLYYIFDIYSGFISSFDLETRLWSDVRTLRPPGMMFGYLISCGDRLILVGLVRGVNYDEFEIILWRVDEKTLEFREIGIMPRDLLSGFLEVKVDSSELPRLMKCVGSEDVVYVFGEEQYGPWNCCIVCRISDSGECRWKRVPNLPEPVNRILDEGVMVSAICTNVSLLAILEEHFKTIRKH